MKLLHTASMLCIASLMLGALSACETTKSPDAAPVTPPSMMDKPAMDMPGKMAGNCHARMKMHHEKMMQKHQRMQEQKARMFGRMDENGDGKISSSEHAQAHDNRFAAMDANDDGELTFEEFVPFRKGPKAHKGHHGKKQNKKASKKQALFAKLDANHDGKVSRQEFEIHAAAQFTKADSNGDESVDMDEFNAHHMARQGMKKHHKMHKMMARHHKCMAGEMKAGKTIMHKAKAMFTKLDANGDGKVTSAEHDALHEQKIAKDHPDWVGTAKAVESIAHSQAEFKKADTDGDGSWTFHEFVIHFMSEHAPWPDKV